MFQQRIYKTGINGLPIPSYNLRRAVLAVFNVFQQPGKYPFLMKVTLAPRLRQCWVHLEYALVAVRSVQQYVNGCVVVVAPLSIFSTRER